MAAGDTVVRRHIIARHRDNGRVGSGVITTPTCAASKDIGEDPRQSRLFLKGRFFIARACAYIYDICHEGAEKFSLHYRHR